MLYMRMYTLYIIVICIYIYEWMNSNKLVYLKTPNIAEALTIVLYPIGYNLTNKQI